METIIIKKNIGQAMPCSKHLMFKKVVLLILLVFCVANVNAQLDKQLLNMTPTKSFQDINISETKYLDSLKQVVDSVKFYCGGGEYKSYQKFKSFWEPRLYPNANFDKYFLAEKEYYSSSATTYSNVSNEPWHEIGPVANTTGIGPVEFISFFDNGTQVSTEHMLTGSLTGGLFYSNDYGESWKSTGTDTEWSKSGCSWAVFHPSNYSTWYASSSGNDRSGQSLWIGRTGGIYKTTNEGQTWLQIADKDDLNGVWTIIYKLIIDPLDANILYAATSSGVFKTTNCNSANPTWTNVLSYLTYDLELKPNDNSILYSSSFKNGYWTIMKTTNKGISWAAIQNQPAIVSNSDVRYSNFTIEVSKAKPDYLYCSVDISGSGSFYYCNISLNNVWAFIGSNTISHGWGHGFAVEQVLNGEEIMVSFNTQMKKYNILTGTSATKNSNHYDVEDIIYHPYIANQIWSCTHGGTEKSIDGGTTWLPKYTGLGVGMVDKMATAFNDPSRILVGLYHDGTHLTTTPYNSNWEPSWKWIFGGDGQRPLINNNDAHFMLSSYQGGNWAYTTDYFNPGSMSYFGSPTYWGSEGVLNKVTPSVFYRNRKSTGLREEVCRRILGTTTEGNISNFSALLPNYAEIIILGMVTPYYNENYLMVFLISRNTSADETFHVFRTKTATLSTPYWEELNIPRQGWISAIEYEPENPDKVYLVYSNSSDENNWPKANKIIYKIDYTNATSPIFTDLTRNLPYTYTGVSCIAAENDNNGGVYLSTDFGVYYVNNNFLSNYGFEWQLVGTGLPHVMGNGLEINYFSNKLRMGTGGRGAWEIPLPCLTNTAAIVLTQDKTLNTVKRFDRDIIIKNGVTLTINSNARIAMGATNHIIVEPGAKLIVNGGVITSGFNYYWGGIQVWGTTSSCQFPVYNGKYQQGYLELNNATIENAICAVDLWKPNDYTKTGGIVIATNSNFINNTNSVHAAYYINHHPTNGSEMDNIANFTNCTFSLNQNYIPANTFYKHIDLALVRGVKFNGCDFSLANDGSAVSESNQAIQSYSSSFFVNAICNSPTMPCSSYDKCTFTGFNWGIKVTKDETSTRTFSVNRALFSNNTFGIHVAGVNNESVLNSEFAIGNNHAYCHSAQGYGIYLDNSTGFAIEENTFTKMAGAPQANYFGVQVNNCNGIDDIYKNIFTGLSYANYAASHDWVYPNTYNGLEWGCNQNSNNFADFYVTSDPVSGIQAFQGQMSLSAGNTFSSGATWHFYNGGTHLINYYYNPSITAQVPGDSKINYLVNKQSTTANNTCPSHYGGGGSAISTIVLNDQQKTEKEVQYASALADYTNVKTLYNNLKDGGSTDAKLADIETAQPQDMWALRAELLGSSPHLSKEVLLKVADKTSVFTESVIFDILSANPDELKNEELLKYLEDKENPLPQYMIDILRQVATGTSYKTVLQQQLSLYNRNKTRAANDMIRSYLNDTVTDYVQLRNWLDNLGGIEADRQIVASYAQEGNFNSAFSLANAMPQLYNLQGTELTEHNQYMQLLALQQTLQNENRGITMLTEPEIADLATIAEIIKSSAGATAKGILESFYNKHFCDCPEVAGTISFKKSNVDPAELGKIYGLDITAKPNPATNWVAFDYTLPENKGTAILTLTDITGKTVESFNLNGQQGQKVWDTRDVKSGTYIYTLQVASFNKTGKIVITK